MPQPAQVPVPVLAGALRREPLLWRRAEHGSATGGLRSFIAAALAAIPPSAPWSRTRGAIKAAARQGDRGYTEQCKGHDGNKESDPDIQV